MKQSATPSRLTRFRSHFRRFALPLLLIAAAGISQHAQAQNYSLSNIWALTGATQNLDTSADNRGMTYAGSSNGTPVNLVLVNNKGTHAIYAYDGATGNLVTGVNSNNLSGGNFTLNKIGVTPAGQLLGANLTTSITNNTFKLYTWGDWSQPAIVSYTSAAGDALVANLAGKRIGDSFARTGSGVSNLMLFTIGGSNAFVLFSTVDGTNFTPTVLTVSSGLPAPGSGVQVGYAFYTNNTFMLLPNGLTTGSGAGNMYLIQYPSNFASLPSPVTATVIATNSTLPTGSAGNWVDLSYDPASGLLALHPNASTPINLYKLSSTNFSSLALLSSTTLSFSTSTTVNGNESGDIALGGTNDIYTLDTSAGLQGTEIVFVAAAVPPSITSLPVGGSIYANPGGFTFSVAAIGTQPLAYQWQYNTVSNLATAVNISGATNSSYSITNVSTSNTGWYDVYISNAGGSTNSPPVLLTVSNGLANASVTKLFSLAADNSEPYLDTSYNTRGLAFDPHTMTVLLAEHATANIYAIDALTGSNLYTVTTPQTGLPNGSIFPVGQVGVADDGVLYVCNVSSYQPGQQNGMNDFSITRFDMVTNYSNVSGGLEDAFTGDPGVYSPGNPGVSSMDRWGDSFAVRGGGVNTQILLGTYETVGANLYGTGPGTNVAILTTTDGIDFTPTTIAVTNAPDGFSYLGVAWGAGNTFWAKSPGFDLYQISYDLTTGIGTVIQDFASTAGQGSLSDLDGIGLDITNNILAGVLTSDTPNDLELFQIPSAGAPPQAYYQAFFAAYNPNENGNAATTVKYPYIYSLDANNGIIGLKYSIPLLSFNITVAETAGKLVLTFPTMANHTYQIQSTAALATSGTNMWTNVGSPVAATSSSLSYTNSSPTGTSMFYRVVAQ
jgi:hypothetical protein